MEGHAKLCIDTFEKNVCLLNVPMMIEVLSIILQIIKIKSH